LHFKRLLLCATLIASLMVSVATMNGQELSAPVLTAEPVVVIQSNFSQPSDVVVGNNKRIYVLDGVNNLVKVFNYKGVYLFSFGGAGSGKGKFNFPLGIGLGEKDRIYVADSGNHRVQIFSPEGECLRQFTTESGKENAKPSDPTDVVVNSILDRCYVVDNDNHWIFIYDLEEGKLLRTHGTMGMEKRDFRFPFLLDTDQEGNLYAVEVINARVKVVDPEGAFLTNIGRWGVEKGEFYRPKGVAIDSKGRVFVSDSYLGVIQVFDREGRFLSIVGDKEGAIMKFKTPTGLFIDKKMRLYVVEMCANRVRVLSLKD